MGNHRGLGRARARGGVFAVNQFTNASRAQSAKSLELLPRIPNMRRKENRVVLHIVYLTNNHRTQEPEPAKQPGPLLNYHPRLLSELSAYEVVQYPPKNMRMHLKLSRVVLLLRSSKIVFSYYTSEERRLSGGGGGTSSIKLC